MYSPDRTIIPGINRANLDTLPEVREYLLVNNIPLFLINAGTEDLVKLDFIFKAGQVHEVVPLQASVSNMMLLEGSINFSAEEMNKLLDFYGTFPHLFVDKDSAGFSIIFLSRHTEKIIELCREIIFNPSFNENEFRTLINKSNRIFDSF